MITSVVVNSKVYDVVLRRGHGGYLVYLERGKDETIYVGFVIKYSNYWKAAYLASEYVDGFVNRYYASIFIAITWKNKIEESENDYRRTSHKSFRCLLWH